MAGRNPGSVQGHRFSPYIRRATASLTPSGGDRVSKVESFLLVAHGVRVGALSTKRDVAALFLRFLEMQLELFFEGSREERAGSSPHVGEKLRRHTVMGDVEEAVILASATQLGGDRVASEVEHGKHGRHDAVIVAHTSVWRWLV